jgi:hypothetical protein
MDVNAMEGVACRLPLRTMAARGPRPVFEDLVPTRLDNLMLRPEVATVMRASRRGATRPRRLAARISAWAHLPMVA